jgi:hypothetical protein
VPLGVLLLTCCWCAAGVSGASVVIQQAPGAQGAQLLAALQNASVTDIQFAGDYAVGSAFDPYIPTDATIKVNRCAVVAVVWVGLWSWAGAAQHAVADLAGAWARVIVPVMCTARSVSVHASDAQQGARVLPDQPCCALARRNITLRGLPGARPPPVLDLHYRQGVVEMCDACWVVIRDMAIANERMVSRGVAAWERSAARWRCLAPRAWMCWTSSCGIARGPRDMGHMTSAP